MELAAEERGGDIVVQVEDGRIDAAVAVKFKDAVRAHGTGPHPRLILDLSRVEFLDSSGLGAVVAVYKEVSAAKAFALAGLTPTVAKVFRLTRMDTVFTIHETVEDAFDGVAHAS